MRVGRRLPGWFAFRGKTDRGRGRTQLRPGGLKPLAGATKFFFLDPEEWFGGRIMGRGAILELRFCCPDLISKGLILAQNERWRRGLGMQVVRTARSVAQG